MEEAREQIPANSELVLLMCVSLMKSRGKIEGALQIDSGLGQQIVSSWPRGREIIVYCERGEGILEATQFLRQKGFRMFAASKVDLRSDRSPHSPTRR